MSVDQSVNVILDIDQEFIYHLTSKESFEYILREGVTDNLLITPISKNIFHFVQHHYVLSGQVPDRLVVENEFPKFEFNDPSTEVEWLIEKIKLRYQSKEVETLIYELAEKQSNPQAAMQLLGEKYLDIQRNTIGDHDTWGRGDHKLFIASLQEQIMEGFYKGSSIGFDEVDTFTGGIKKGNVAYILARMKMGKTFLILNAFLSQIKDGERPILFTLENTKDEIMLRLSCMISGIPWNRAYKGDITAKEWKLLAQSWEELDCYGDYWIDSPPLNERTVSSMVLKADKLDAGTIFLSQFRYIKGVREWYNSEWAEPAEIAVDLKRAATATGRERPIIVEGQFNRGGDSMQEFEDFDGSKVGLTDMIAQTADTLYGIFQSKEQKEAGISTFGILLARNHGRGAWYYRSDFSNTTKLELLQDSFHD